jgi:tetratricopeptide (TPR) repeat protein
MHRRSLPRRLASTVSLGLALAVASVGCAAKKADPNVPTEGEHALALTPISDAEFATAVHRLLREGARTPERSALLAGTVRRQLAHAAEYFSTGNDVRGVNAVVGAFYLLRIGEARPDMFDEGVVALEGAVERFSARGDEGRALTLMLVLKQQLAPGSVDALRLETHLTALKRWMGETRTGGEMSKLAADERAAVGRALLDPTQESLDNAATSINKWIKRAVEYNLRYQQTRQLPPREEVSEAYRALQSGGETIAALYLRYGLAQQALEVIEGSAAGRVTGPAFFARLRAAAQDDTAEDWRLLARDFARLAFAEGERPLDRALVDAALWGISLEAYRRDPTSLAIGHLLADQLIELGLPEVAPLVLRDALGPQPSVVSLSAVMSTVAAALSEQFDTRHITTARRIYAASSNVLSLADRSSYKGRLKPSASQLRQLMAGIELGNGNMDRARPLLESALRAEPTVWGYTMLGTLERQAGNVDAALGHATRAVELPAARVLPLDVASAKLLSFEIERDKGNSGNAEQALEDALAIALTTRKRGTVESKVRAERILARVLDGYGERQSAARAIERALNIAGTHRQILSETMLSAVARALVYKNVAAARVAIQTGIKAKVDVEDLVYGALWLMFLEQELGERPDGKVDRVLLTATQGDDWTSHLARWARDIVDDDALRKSASSYAQHVEAEFYIAMRASIKGATNAKEQLEKVANNPLIDLMEVQLARDILAPKMRANVPKKYRVP